jgi:uncharacterized membrane protein YkoI
MRRKIVGTLALLVLLVSSFTFAQFQQQPPVPELPPEVPAVPEEELSIPIDQLIETVKAANPGTLVSIKLDKGVFGREKGSYTFKFDDGMEIQVDKGTGEILETKEGNVPDEETLNLISMASIPLEEAVKTVMDEYPENQFKSATIEENETGQPVYSIELSDITVKVNASTGEIIFPEGESEIPGTTESSPSEIDSFTEEEAPSDEFLTPESTENF